MGKKKPFISKIFGVRIINKLCNRLGYNIVPTLLFFDFLEKTNNKQKYLAELNFWVERFEEENKNFRNEHYKKLMLAMAKEETDAFLNNKIVADFGCGPRGSLVWTQAPAMKIGIDVLVDQYFDTFGETLLKHNYLYVKSTEHHIPLPTEFVDVVYTINAMDHTENFSIIASEILRILKKGGIFMGSFNLNEPPTVCEPLTLTESIVKESFFDKLEIEHSRIVINDKKRYDNFSDPNAAIPKDNQKSILWVRGIKK